VARQPLLVRSRPPYTHTPEGWQTISWQTINASFAVAGSLAFGSFHGSSYHSSMSVSQALSSRAMSHVLRDGGASLQSKSWQLEEWQWPQPRTMSVTIGIGMGTTISSKSLVGCALEITVVWLFPGTEFRNVKLSGCETCAS
jgi:hypothetical protein